MGLLGVEATADTGLFATGGVILLSVESLADGEIESLADGEIVYLRHFNFYKA